MIKAPGSEILARGEAKLRRQGHYEVQLRNEGNEEKFVIIAENANNNPMVQELTFRRAQETDLEAMLDLLRDLHAEDAPASRTELHAVWEEILRNDGIRHYLAESGGTLVAACHLVVVPNLTRGTKPYGVIENVVTRVGYRRQGIGIRMLQHVLEEAWSLGCYKVMLMTGREDVHQFYEKAGFKPGLKTAFVAKPEER